MDSKLLRLSSQLSLPEIYFSSSVCLVVSRGVVVFQFFDPEPVWGGLESMEGYLELLVEFADWEERFQFCAWVNYPQCC